MNKPHFIAGIDEAGRGPIAGPVAVGGVVWEKDDSELAAKLKILFPVVKDSKQFSEKKREEIFSAIVALSKETTLRYSVALVSATAIDARGIVPAIRSGIVGVLEKIAHDPQNTHVLLDGGLKAPEVFVNQETCIRGDATHLPIALASIMAKVLRDRHMIALAKKHPEYGFEKHKGYGTKVHYVALATFGMTAVHRKSFLKSNKVSGKV